jgi:RHS repeat-associated protein
LGGIYPDTAYSIQQTADKGYILAGTSFSFTHTSTYPDFLIYKLDANGNEQWRKNYGGSEIWESTNQSYAPTNSSEKGKNNKNGEHKDSLQNDAFPPYDSNQGGPFVGDVLNSTFSTSIINKKTSETNKILSESLYNTYYIYSGDKLIEEYDNAGNCVKEYIYLGNRLVAEYIPQTGKYYYYMSDQINSSRVIIDDDLNVVYSAAHGPYGDSLKIWVNTYDPNPKFSGKEREGYTNHDYFGARYYDKSTFRFTSVDPIINKSDALGNPQLWNLYSYCRNSPITYFDPDGREEKSIWQKLKDVAGKVVPKNMLPNTMQMEGWEQTVKNYDKTIVKAKKIVLFLGGAVVIIEIAKGISVNPDGTEKDPADQLEQIEKAQKLPRKSKKQGEKYKPIDSIKKSKNRLKHKLKSIKKLKDVDDAKD